MPVEVEIVADAPPLDRERRDHVAEASLARPSGRFEIHEGTGGSVDILPVPPGTYRGRVEYGGPDTLDEDRLESEDHSRIVPWPAPFAEVAVLTQSVDPRASPS